MKKITFIHLILLSFVGFAQNAPIGEDISKLLGITKDCFSEVGMTKWKNIQRKFEEKFIEKKSYKSSFQINWQPLSSSLS